MLRDSVLGQVCWCFFIQAVGMRSSLFVRRLLRVSQKSPLSRRWPVLSAVLRLGVGCGSEWAGGWRRERVTKRAETSLKNERGGRARK